MKVTRRDAIKIGAVGAAAAGVAYRVAGLPGLPGLTLGAKPSVRPAATYVPSVCLQCPAGCGILVRVVDGRAVKIEGNPLHPINEGRLCPKGQIGLQILYDPDRIREPLVRPALLEAYESGTVDAYLASPTRARTPGDFVPVPGATAADQWATAIGIAASVLGSIRQDPGPHAVAFLSGRNRGQMGDFIGRFCTAYGTPNNIGHSSICADGSEIAHDLAQGWKAYAGYDWDRTNYLLCFGGSFVEAWRPTTRLLRAYGTMRRGRPVRGKIVQIEPRLSVTAAKADEWLPIRPGTDGALATAIAGVIIREGLYDAAFLRDHTNLSHLVRDDTGEVFVESEWEDPPGSGKVFRRIYAWDELTDGPVLWNTQTKAWEPSTAARPALSGSFTVGGIPCRTTLDLWKSAVLDEMTPAVAEGITGVPAATIERIAREFATTKPAIAAGERGSSMQTNGIYNRFAIHALNALAGSVDVPGGILMQRNPPFTSWPSVALDAAASDGLAKPRFDFAGTKAYPLAGKVYQGVPDVLLGRPDPGGRTLAPPYPIKGILCYYTNPLFSTPDRSRWEEALAKVPFVATFSPFLDETSAMADLILPDDTYLERWHDDVIYPSLGYPVAGLRQPVVDRLYKTQNAGTTLLQIALRLGGSVAASFRSDSADPGTQWADFLDVLRFRYRGVYESGGIVGDIPVASLPTFEDFWDAFAGKGVWKNPGAPTEYPYGEWSKVLATPTGTFEFFAWKLHDKLEHIAEDEAAAKGTTTDEELEALLASLQIQARGIAVYLPHYEPARYVGDAAEYPFHLVTYKLMIHAEGRGANVPLLRGMVPSHMGGVTNWETWAEMHPSTASQAGLEAGAQAWVESPVRDAAGAPRRILVRVVTSEGVMPGVVCIPFENGHTAYGRWARAGGANPNLVLANAYDLLGGLAAFSATRVRLIPAGGT